MAIVDREQTNPQQPAAPGRLWARGLVENLYYALPAAYRDHIRHFREEMRLRRNHPLPDDWYIVRVGRPGQLTPKDFELRPEDFHAKQHVPGISAGVLFAGRRDRNALVLIARGRFAEARDHLHFARVGDIREVTGGQADVVYSPVGSEHDETDGDKSHSIIAARNPNTGELTRKDFPQDVREAIAAVFRHESKWETWPPTALEISRASRRRKPVPGVAFA